MQGAGELQHDVCHSIVCCLAYLRSEIGNLPVNLVPRRHEETPRRSFGIRDDGHRHCHHYGGGEEEDEGLHLAKHDPSAESD